MDLVTYLPLDTASNARRFIKLLKPELAIFIKYEFWFNHLAELKNQNVRTILMSGRIHKGQQFFKPWGKFFRKGLETFNYFYLQDQKSASLLKGIGISRLAVNGDSRFDRVKAIKEQNKTFPKFETFIGTDKVIILGSSWPAEEKLLNGFIKEHGDLRFKVIIAPHEIDPKRIAQFSADCQLECSRMSQWKGETARVMFVDSIGMLAQIYRYGTVAVVGGGFGAGIHNLLEPAVWGVPVIMGPKYEQFQEALGLVAAGGAFPVEGQKDFNAKILSLLEDNQKQKETSSLAELYCIENQGATEIVMKGIRSMIR